LLADAKAAPLIMAGGRPSRQKAARTAELIELAELLGAPVYTEFVPSTASFPASHPLFPRLHDPAGGPDGAQGARAITTCCSRSAGDSFSPCRCPSDVDPMAAPRSS